MTKKQKETLLEALTVLRELSSEFSQKTVQHARHLCGKTKPIVVKLGNKGIGQCQKLQQQIASKKHYCKRAITVVALVAVSAGVYQSLPESPSSDSSEVAAQPPVEKAIPEPRIESQKMMNTTVANRIAAAQRQAAIALQKAQIERQAAQARLAAEKRKLEASAKARQAKIAALKAEQRARVARNQPSRTTPDAASLFLGIPSNRPVELGFGPSSRSSSGYRNQSVNRDMQRYQRHMSGTMAARGVR